MNAVLDDLEQAIVLHHEGVVQYLNPAAEMLWNISLDQATGRDIMEVVRRHTLAHMRSGSIQLELHGKTYLCKATSSALMFSDISSKIHEEREMREVMAVLSHEFRTPLAGVLGVLEALEYDLPNELKHNFIQQGLHEVRRLIRLVEDMTVGFRITHLRDIHFAEVADRLKPLLQEEALARGITLQFVGTDTPLKVDPDKLLQVLLNLIENAMRYGPQQSRVHIAAYTTERTWISVSDCGELLPDYHVLFQPQWRGGQLQGTGTGMGLYIVKTIVEHWGGTVTAEPVPGVGNVFRFTLPETRKEALY